MTHDPLFWLRRCFLAALALLAFGLLLQPLNDPDVFLHLRDGRYWVESHFHVDREPFAYTVPDVPFDKSEWLFRIGSYLTWRLGGYNLLILLKAVIMTVALFLLGWLVYRRWRNLGVTGLLLLWGMLAPMAAGFPERPYIFTYLFLPLSLLLVDNFRQGRPHANRHLWFLAPLTALWVNLHPGFLVLLPFLLTEFLQDLLPQLRQPNAIRGQRLRTLGLVIPACVVASFVNPLGPSIYPFVLDTVNSQVFMQNVGEWLPPLWSEQPFFFLLLATVWLLMLARVLYPGTAGPRSGLRGLPGIWRSNLLKINGYDLLPLLLFSWMAVKSYRHIPLFVIACLPLLATGAQEVISPWLRKPFPEARRRWILLAGTALVLATLGIASAQGLACRLGTEPSIYPEAGVAWVSQQPWEGRLFTQYNWAGYLGWITHNRFKIFMDGRMGTFDQSFLIAHHQIFKGNPHCLELLDRFQIEGILISHEAGPGLADHLRRSGQWSLVYWDNICFLYVRRNGPNQTWIGPEEYHHVDPQSAAALDFKHPDLALQEIARAHQAAPESFLPWFFRGEILMQGNQLDKASDAFHRVLALEPKHAGSHYYLAMIADKRGLWQTEESHLQAVWDVTKNPASAGRIAYQLALNLRQQRQPKEALAWARKARNAMPNWEPAARVEEELEKQLDSLNKIRR
jgi:hypothetical protein